MKLFLFLILSFQHAQYHLYLAMAQVTGFQSLDCGSSSTSVYKDTDSDIQWTPDSIMESIGTSASVQAPSSPPYYSTTKRFTTIRYFDSPAFSKFCYILPNTIQGKFYLVRSSFWLGYSPPFTTLSTQQIQFMLLINADLWQNISIALPQSTPLVLEIYVQAISTSISVCLSGTETKSSDVPFISALELRPLNTNMAFLQFTQCALRLRYRENYGPQADDVPVRFQNDSLDRIWLPLQPETGISNYLSTNDATIGNNVADLPPIAVLQTAIEANSSGITLTFPVDYGTDHKYFYALYFSEIDTKVNSSGQRVFSITINGDTIVTSALDVFQLYGLYGTQEVYGRYTTSVGWLNFTLNATSHSMYNPFVSAGEVFECFENPMSNGTFDADIVSINSISTTLSNLSSYTGDPCLPSGYGYPWLTCSLTTTPPRVTNISLSNRALMGQIPASFNNLSALIAILLDGNKLDGQIPDLSALTNLQVLNLSNNKLNGAIPDSLSKLSNLQYLYLQNNNLSGPVPKSLLKRSFIEFDYSGNAFLCTTSNNTCYDGSQSPSSRNTSLKIGLAVFGAFIFLVLLGIVMSIAYWRRRHQRSKESVIPKDDDKGKHVIPHTEMVKASNLVKAFSYHEVQSATNNFDSKLGEGGFGHVYQGTLANGHPVAVKVLLQDSQQGSEQFLNEVNLLSQVHHKNLVKLLGYCTEQKLMLVYEYMSKGSLADLLYGKSSTGPLTWRVRLRVLLDAAQGLEYLHYGCNPQIIHRDVKSSNILLNDKMEAKVADFGISRPTSENSGDFTMHVKGTWGYLDPEYSTTLNLTEKADVYSFGVLMFEVICGRPPFLRNASQPNILEWVRPLIERGLVQDIVDAAIQTDYNLSSLWKVVEIAMMCVEYESKKRPTMNEVSHELKEANRIENDSSRFSEDMSLSYPFAEVRLR